MWTADSSAFYYVRLDANHRPSRVYRHRLGTPAADDALVYEEAGQPLSSSRSGELQSGRFAEISVHDHETSEMLADRSRRSRMRTPRLVAARETSVQYDVEHHPELGRRRDAGDPHQCGRRGRLQDRGCAARPPRPRELARSRPAPARHRTCSRVIVLSDWLIRLEREDSLPRIVVRQHRERRGAHDRVSRRSLLARRRRRLRVRDRPAALLLLVDDDAERGVGLRPEDARAHACASARRCRAGTIRRPT